MTALPVVVLRPEPGHAVTSAAARTLGLEVRGSPLFVPEPLDWDCPDPRAYDGLLIASGNAVRLAGDGLQKLRSLPVHAVGGATAEAVRDAGLTVASQGAGGIETLMARLAPPARLLRLAGKERVALTPPHGLIIDTRVVYTVRTLQLPPDVVAELRAGAVVLLHSAAAARHFGSECGRLGVARSRLALACIGPRVAQAADSGWGMVASAPTPDDPALLALAKQLCQTFAPGVTDSQNADGQ